MIEAIEVLRNLASLMFWAFADLILGGLWIAIIFGLLVAIVEGTRNDD